MPHPEFFADLLNGAVVSDMNAIWAAPCTTREYNLCSPNASLLAYQTEFSASLQWESMIVKGKQNDFIQTLSSFGSNYFHLS
jgi:hypothetical protein